MTIKEADIESYLVQQVKLAGGEIRKTKWIGRKHAPDRYVMLPHSERRAFGTQDCFFWIELKAPGEKPTEGQRREHQRMTLLGVRVCVVDSYDGVDKALKT